MERDEESIITRSSQTPGTMEFIYSKCLLMHHWLLNKTMPMFEKESWLCTSHCHAGKQCSNQQDTKLFCANESKVQQKNCDIKKNNEMASKK